MAKDDVRKFNFFQEYTWQVGDFVNMQLWEKELRTMPWFALGPAVLAGLSVAPVSGLNVQAEPGVAVNADGLAVNADAALQAEFASPTGNPAKSLLVLRPFETAVTDIPEPLNPINTVQLHQRFDHQLVAIDGTPAASPAYPSVNPEDIILMGVNLGASQTVITQADFDFSQRQVPLPFLKHTRIVTSTYTVALRDDIIEADATAGAFAVTLPDVLLARGRTYTVMKVDNSANAVQLDTPGAEQINGQDDWDLTVQWEKLKVYSNGQQWRIL